MRKLFMALVAGALSFNMVAAFANEGGDEVTTPVEQPEKDSSDQG